MLQEPIAGSQLAHLDRGVVVLHEVIHRQQKRRAAQLHGATAPHLIAAEITRQPLHHLALQQLRVQQAAGQRLPLPADGLQEALRLRLLHAFRA